MCRRGIRSSCRSRSPGRDAGRVHIFIGVNALDYSGYPDCRPEYIAAFQALADLATKAGVEGQGRLTIHTPLIELSKKEIIATGRSLGVDYGLTLSCYDPAPDGAACGRCDACLLRLKGICGTPVRGPDSLPAGGAGGAGGAVSYSVKELYYTFAGRGRAGGSAGVFLRFAGCNLWTGREADRASATCRFCDTDFVDTDGPGGGRFTSAAELASAVSAAWPTDALYAASPMVVCTGGEPLLQLDEPLVEALHERDLKSRSRPTGR